MRLVSVAVPVPLLKALTYRVPDGFPTPAPGSRVLVPLGTRQVTGCVIAADGSDGERGIKDLLDVFDLSPMLPADVLALALWIAEYYACGPGEAVAAAMPPRAWVESRRRIQITDLGRARLETNQVRGRARAALHALRDGRVVPAERLASALAGGRGRRRAAGLHALVSDLAQDGLISVSQPLRGTPSAFKSVRTVKLTAQGHDVASSGNGGKRPLLGGRQRQVLDVLRGAPDGLDVATLGERGVSSETIRRLAQRGLLVVDRRTVERDPFLFASDQSPSSMRAGLTPTTEQQAALNALTAFVAEGRFRAVLLHGVTGSGKTEIYVRVAEVVRAGGKRVLVLVPEIALTPALVTAFRAAFGSRVAIQHSGLSDGERHDQWHRIRRGDVDVVIGTRSAVFAPLDRLGLIIVDEEHDTSYKQEDSPRYHARDVAVLRGKHAAALVVLGSATPSMESYYNALHDRYVRITLSQRVLARPLAAVEIVDMRDEYAACGPEVIFSRCLQQRLLACLERRDQALVLLNRRGFAPVVFCRQCGATLECPNCSVSLTYHRAVRRSQCHYCNYSVLPPRTCRQCGGPYLEQSGFGTERIEAELGALVSGARVARLDRDTVRQRGQAAALLERFARGDIDVLVGTQMIAKGHDFPKVTLVGVVSADVGLGLADFRAAERTFQLLMQVAGRAGRGESPGEAIVQTLFPHHYSIRYGCRQEYLPFYEEEIRFRRGMRYPPTVSLINAIVRARTLSAAMTDAAALASRLRAARPTFRVLGPAPAPLSRLRGEHRAQLFIKGTHRSAMRRALQAALESAPNLTRRVTIDVDPVSVL